MSATRRPHRRAAAALVALLLVLAPGVLGAGIARAQTPQPTPGPTQAPTTTTPAPTTTTPTPQPTPQPSPSGEEPAGTEDPAGTTTDEGPSQGTGLFEDLGGDSPFCTDKAPGDIGAAAAESCRRTGAIANSYPTDNYGLDNNVDVGVTSPTTWITSTLQWLIGVIWLGLIYLVKGVLMALEWAFTTDIYDASKKQSSDDVLSMYKIVGAPWLTFALAVAGLWGLWNGLVRRRSIETMGALLVTVAMMVAAQVIIHNPGATVGHLSDMSNKAALGALGAASEGTVDEPAETFADAHRRLFDSIVLRPWCALQFGDVAYCTAEHGDTSVADVWLSFTPGSKPRQLLYKRTKSGGDGVSLGDQFKSALSAGWSFLKFDPGEAYDKLTAWQKAQAKVSKKADKVVEKSPRHVELQESGGTMKRFALLVLVGAGVLGAVLLIGSIAVRLLIQGGLMTLLLLLLSPVALLAPAFGEKGRRAFATYCAMFGAAIASKFIYSILLAVVILISGILAGLEQSLGWLPGWIVQSTFWWSLYLRRRELLAMVSLDTGRRGNAMTQIYYAMRIGRSARQGAAAVTVRPVRAALRPLRRNAHAYRTGEEHVAHDHALEYAGRRAREVHADEHAARYAAASDQLATLGTLRGQQATNRGELSDIDRQLRMPASAAGAPDAAQRAQLEARRTALNAENRRLEETAQEPRFAHARAVAARGPEAQPMDDRDVQRWVQQRRFDTDNHAWDHDSNLRAAGIDPVAHRAAVSRAATPGNTADQDLVADHQARSTEHMRRDRVMLAAADTSDRHGAPMSRAERRARVRYAEHAHGAQRTQDEIDMRARAERRRARAERQRARMYR